MRLDLKTLLASVRTVADIATALGDKGVFYLSYMHLNARIPDLPAEPAGVRKIRPMPFTSRRPFVRSWRIAGIAMLDGRSDAINSSSVS